MKCIYFDCVQLVACRCLSAGVLDGIYLCTVHLHAQCLVCHTLVLISVLHFVVARIVSVVFVLKRLFLDVILVCKVNGNVLCNLLVCIAYSKYSVDVKAPVFGRN